MKRNIYALLLLVLPLFVSCSGSTVYQGEWKATDKEGNQYEIIFEPKDFVVKSADGESTTHSYTQNSIEIKNSIKKYGIKLSDGRAFNILFPIANDTTKAVILTGGNSLMYTLSRSEYLSNSDLYKLN